MLSQSATLAPHHDKGQPRVCVRYSFPSCRISPVVGHRRLIDLFLDRSTKHKQKSPGISPPCHSHALRFKSDHSEKPHVTDRPSRGISAGNIAAVATGVKASRRGRLARVGPPRRRHRPRPSVGTYHIPIIKALPGAVIDDPTVQAVYTPSQKTCTTNATIKALDAGKTRPLRKDLRLDLAQAQEMFDSPSRHGTVLVEAFSTAPTRSPRVQSARQRRSAARPSPPHRTSFCFKAATWQGNIRFTPH